MKNFLISSVINLCVLLVSFFLFKIVISGPTRHRLYEKFLSSFAKFVIYIFIATVIITALTALFLYKTRYISYINVISPALLSILIGFIGSTVPTKGVEDSSK